MHPSNIAFDNPTFGTRWYSKWVAASSWTCESFRSEIHQPQDLRLKGSSTSPYMTYSLLFDGLEVQKSHRDNNKQDTWIVRIVAIQVEGVGPWFRRRRLRWEEVVGPVATLPFAIQRDIDMRRARVVPRFWSKFVRSNRTEVVNDGVHVRDDASSRHVAVAAVPTEQRTLVCNTTSNTNESQSIMDSKKDDDSRILEGRGVSISRAALSHGIIARSMRNALIIEMIFLLSSMAFVGMALVRHRYLASNRTKNATDEINTLTMRSTMRTVACSPIVAVWRNDHMKLHGDGAAGGTWMRDARGRLQRGEFAPTRED